jgi:polar amino acid transport system substrate-binding protein
MTLDPHPAPSQAVRDAFMPTGRLRAAMNFSNTVIALRDRGDGEPGGVTAALARDLARRLGAELEFIDYDSPGVVVDAIAAGEADICFLAIEPKRREVIDFSAPYVLIESNYVARTDGPFRTSDDVDRDGVTVITRARAAYDLYLARNLKAAKVLPIVDDELDAFVAGQGDVASGIKPMLEDYFAGKSGYTILNPPFVSVGQAMGVGKGRGPAFAYLEAFVEEMKANGFVGEALRASNSRAMVAPPAEHIP